MKKQILSEEFQRMQKLAGLINESQLNEAPREGVYDDFNKWKASFPEGTEFKSENNYMVARDKENKELGKWNPVMIKGMHVDDVQYKSLEEKTSYTESLNIESAVNEALAKFRKLAGIITESQLNEESLEQYTKKIADQHNLMLLPQPFNKSALYSMWKKEKGSFGNKEGVITFEPNTKTVNVLSSDEKIPGAVFVQFKRDRGGNDQGFETKTFNDFASEGGKKGYFKSFMITNV